MRGELKSMRADPAYRGRGVGKAILLHLLAEARARGYGRVSLETGRPEPFLPARRLYEKLGFAALGVRRGFYSAPPDDAVVMRKDL